MSKSQDRLFNSLVRLTNQLAAMRQTLCELSQINATSREDDDPGYLAEQVRREFATLEFMAQEATKLYEPQASKIAQAVARLMLQRPENHLSYSAMVVDGAWRARNLISAQFVIHAKKPKQLLSKLAGCADLLAAFDASSEIIKGLILEHRSAATLDPQPDEAASEIITSHDARKLLNTKSNKSLQIWTRKEGVTSVGRGNWNRADILRVKRNRETS